MYGNYSVVQSKTKTRHMKPNIPTYEELENQISALKKQNDFQIKQISNLIETNLDIAKLKEIENELQKSYNLLSKLASQVPGVIYQYRLYPDGSSAFPYSSPGMYDIYEVTSEEVKENASAVFTRIHPDDYNSIVDSITQSARNQTTYSTEFRVILPKQGLRWRHCDAKPELLEDGSTLWHGIITDITERKQIEQELIKAKEKAEESEQRFKLASVSGLLGIWDWNVKDNIMFWEERMFELYGINHDTFPNNIDAWTNGLHPEDKQRAIDECNAALNGEKDFNTTFRVIHPNGTILYLKADGLVIRDNANKAIRMIGINKDITERKLAEEELKKSKEKTEESEAKLQFIFDTMSEGIALNECIYNDKGEMIDYKILEVNQAFYKNAEIPDMKVVGRYATEVYKMPVDLITQFWKEHSKKTEHVVTEYKSPILQNWFRISTSTIINNKFVTAFFDITEEQKLRQELILAKEKAEESDRLKTAFLQNMSHEIRTPLNAISGFSGMLNKPELSEEKRKSFISIIQNSSKQLVSIVSDILTISSLETKQEKQNIDKVCINNIILDLLAIFKLQAQNQNISLYAKQQLNDKQSEIYTDKTKITQILTNLLTNALKFTHEGFIEFGYNLKDSELEFYVKDSGIGIKPEFHEKIFERFRQADISINKLYGGTGLGLAISKAFVELLGGKIGVQSELEKGSNFYFTIPYKPVNEIDKSTTPTKRNENFKTILVAEDEEYNFLYIEELLIDMDLKIIHAKDGKETVDIFKSNPNIDLILMDIKMPIMTGHEAAKIIKELKPSLPIVAQSAYALEHERAKYEEIFDDYLTKPINENDLKSMVMKYIDVQKKE